MHKGEAYHINQLSQQQLVAAFKTNDESVMKELYLANYPKVKVFVLQNGGTSNEAKDIYQEAFIAVWKNIRNDRFTPYGDGAVSSYLYRIAKNKWIDHLRSARQTKTISENQLHKVSLNHNVEHPESTDDAQERKIKQITEAFGRLGQSCQQLLEEFYFNRKSCREIAEELGIQESSVRNKKYRCMLKLRQLVLGQLDR